MNTRTCVALTALCAVVFVLACGAPPRRMTVSGSLDDATLTVRVKTALLNDPGVGGQKIDVQTSQGIVTLSGTVRSRDEENTAVTLARRVEGVKDVKSVLRIEP